MAGVLSVEDVLITREFELRPTRPARLQSEVQALHRLMRNFSEDTGDLLNEVVLLACELCDADSAGITVEDTRPDGSKGLIWIATTGKIGDLRGSRIARDGSPCGTVLDRNMPLVFRQPRRFYQQIDAEWNICEALLVPWGSGSEIVGTFWLLAQSEDRKFDREDLRMLQSLVAFAEAAVLKERVDTQRRHQETNSSMAHLANQLAHEVNNPLQALTNLLHLIDPGSSPEHLHNGKLQLDRVTQLVQAILLLDMRQKASGESVDPLLAR